MGSTTEANTLYREGAGYAPFTPTVGTGDYSFYRDLRTGLPKDADDNAADFILVDTNGVTTGIRLGTPGPQNTQQPVQRNGEIKASLIDPQCAEFGAGASACARYRDGTPVPNGAAGTLSIRRKFTNMTGQPVTHLRFRIVDITTQGTRAPGQADLRALDSGDVILTLTDGSTVQVNALTLNQTPAQASGGGLNSSLRAASITLGTPLAPNDSINVEFRLGVMVNGEFSFFVNVEALPTSATAPNEGRRTSGLKKRVSERK